MKLTDKLSHHNMKDIMILNKIAGRSMYLCMRAIKETSNIGEAIELLSRSGIPCIAFAKKEDEEKFLSNYPTLETMQERVLKVDYNVSSINDIKW